MKLILLSGMPATGKSTMADLLKRRFGFPVLEKDGIKEKLFDTLGFQSYEEKSQLDVAASAILIDMMHALIEADTSMIVDNNFDAKSSVLLQKLIDSKHPEMVTVFFTGDPQVLYERYIERDGAGKRHWGHALQDHYPLREGEKFEFHMTREGYDRRFLQKKMDHMTWGGPVIRVDATDFSKVDLHGIAQQIADVLGL